MFELIIFPTPLTAFCELLTDSGVKIHGVPATHSSGRPGQKFVIPDTVPNGHGAQLIITAQGRVPLVQRGILLLNNLTVSYPWLPGQTAAFTADDFTLSTPPVPTVLLQRLRPRGQFLELEDGGLFTEVETSDFNLLNRSEAGEDITPILTQRAEVGFNTLRVWTAYNIPLIGRLIPAERPGLYQHIPVFLRKCAQHHLRVELTGFTYTFPTDDDKIRHWERLIAACEGLTNVYLELGNEIDRNPEMALPMDRLRRPDAVLASHGSNSQDVTPVNPFWDLATYRPDGNSEWQRKVGHNAMEIWNGPTVSNETIRMPDNDSNPLHAFDAAAGAALLCAGACFHSPEGKNSTLWTGQALVCARAWVAGARSVPLTCQHGAYKHRQDLENDGIIRAYQRGDSDQCIVRIRA